MRRYTSKEEDADLVMVLKQLDDDLDVSVVVLDGDDTHDVGSILSVRIFAVLVGEYKTCIGLFHLTTTSATYTSGSSQYLLASTRHASASFT